MQEKKKEGKLLLGDISRVCGKYEEEMQANLAKLLGPEDDVLINGISRSIDGMMNPPPSTATGTHLSFISSYWPYHMNWIELNWINLIDKNSNDSDNNNYNTPEHSWASSSCNSSSGADVRSKLTQDLLRQYPQQSFFQVTGMPSYSLLLSSSSPFLFYFR